MNATTSSVLLRELFDQKANRVDIPKSDAWIANCWFDSTAWPILPNAHSYECRVHGREFSGSEVNGSPVHAQERLVVADREITENRRFRYSIFMPGSRNKAEGAIILFHGLNERDWSKYLPWAHRLVEETGKAVILFPIAFHMNRAPAEWSDPYLMRPVSEERKTNSPTIVNSTFANAAISTRMQEIPERFCWSGLQTFYDIVQLADEIRTGGHPLFEGGASIDFFGYSIGAFLCEILLMADPDGRFSETRLFMFCGGVTVDRMYPNSRYILDSDATIALYSFFLARFENEMRANERLAHYMSDQHPEGTYFRAMLNYHENKDRREQRLRELAPRVRAVGLKRDSVIPANEILNTLQGDFRDIPTQVEVTDFPYRYSHVVPFPASAPEEEVEAAFDFVFDRAGDHLRR